MKQIFQNFKIKKYKNNSAFTYFETLMAMSIGFIILSLCLFFIFTVLKIHTNIYLNYKIERDIDLFFTQIERDFLNTYKTDLKNVKNFSYLGYKNYKEEDKNSCLILNMIVKDKNIERIYNFSNVGIDNYNKINSYKFDSDLSIVFGVSGYFQHEDNFILVHIEENKRNKIYEKILPYKE